MLGLICCNLLMMKCVAFGCFGFISYVGMPKSIACRMRFAAGYTCAEVPSEMNMFEF